MTYLGKSTWLVNSLSSGRDVTDVLLHEGDMPIKCLPKCLCLYSSVMTAIYSDF